MINADSNLSPNNEANEDPGKDFQDIGKTALTASSSVNSENQTMNNDKARLDNLNDELFNKSSKLSGSMSDMLLAFTDFQGNFSANDSEKLKSYFHKFAIDHFGDSSRDSFYMVEHIVDPENSKAQYRTTNEQENVLISNAEERDRAVSRLVTDISKDFYGDSNFSNEASQILTDISQSVASESAFVRDFLNYLKNPTSEALKSLKDNYSLRANKEADSIKQLLDLNPKPRPDSLSDEAIKHLVGLKESYLDALISYTDFRREHPDLYKASDRPGLSTVEFV